MNIFHDSHHSAGLVADVKPGFTWTMVNVCEGLQQGDAHVISIDDHQHILIDAGQRDMAAKHLLPLLRESGIDGFDLVFISHAHKDHYGGLDVLLDNDIEIRQLYFNLPARSQCLKEIPWGCDYDDVTGVRDRLISAGIEIRTLEPGLRFQLGQHTFLQVLYAFNGVNTPVGETDVNDMSAVMKLHHGGQTILFTGDLNEDIGGYLAETAGDLCADILKIPHHGVDPVVPVSFFEKVAPRCALVSTPASFWLEETGDRVRNWFEKKAIPVYVNGISGHISVILENGKLKIGEANWKA